MKSRGFSLVELIIALGIAMVAVLLFTVVISIIPLTKISRNQNLAYHIAAKKIEELRNTVFSSLPTTGTFTDSGLSDLASSTASITVTDYQSSAEVKEITVVVSWQQENQQKSVSLETLIYDGGISQK